MLSILLSLLLSVSSSIHTILPQQESISEIELPTLASVPHAFTDSIFSRCGTPEEFSDTDWYPSMIEGASSVTFYREEDALRNWSMNKEMFATPQEVVERFGMVKAENIRSICMADNTQFVLLLVSEYMVPGKILVYSLKEHSWSEIPYAPQNKYYSLASMSPQVGTHVEIISSFGDSIFLEERVYTLDISTTELTLIRTRGCVYNEEQDQHECEETVL